MTDTTTTYDAALKEYYTKDRVFSLLFDDHPFLSLLPKDEKWGGLDYFRQPLINSPGGATSSTFATAQTRAAGNSMGVQEFRVDRTTTYGLGYLGETLSRAGNGTVSAFVDASTQFLDQVYIQMANDLSIAMFKTGYGERGQILAGSSVATTVITLSSASDAVNFEVGDGLVVTDALGNAPRALGSSGNPLLVTGIDRDLGTLTFAYNVNDSTNGIPAIAAGDYLGKQGDISATKLKPTGLAGWIPSSAPSATSFFGLDRTIDSQRLGGCRVDGSTLNIIEAINASTSKVAQYQGKTDTIVLSFNQMLNLENMLEGKVRITDHKVKENVGFRSVEVITPTGTANVIADRNCPDNRLYALQKNTWKLATLNNMVYNVGDGSVGDGLQLLRAGSADAWEVRMKFVGNLVCSAPGFNCVTILDT